MCVSLLPVGAMAESASVTIKQQPKSVSVDIGETAAFTIAAATTGGSATYVWVDADKIPVGDVVNLVFTMNKLMKNGEIVVDKENGILGLGSMLTVNDATESMNIACIVFINQGNNWWGLLLGTTAFAVSDIVKLEIKEFAPCTNHVLGWNVFPVEAVPATCAHTGNIKYYCCENCGKCFSDSYLTQEISYEETILPLLKTHGELKHYEAKAGTCMALSSPEYWRCVECDACFWDGYGKKPASKAEIELTAAKDPSNHADVKHGEKTLATCKKIGNIEYWFCRDCKTYFKNAEMTERFASVSDVELPIDSGNHAAMIHHDSKLPKCLEDGSKEYWSCKDCGKFFADSEGIMVITEDDITVAKLGHDYAWKTGNINDYEYHYKECTRCGYITGKEVHKGGSGSCISKPVCDICGLEYGSVDSTVHLNTEIRNELKPSVYNGGYSGDLYCLDCGKLIEAGHAIPKLCIHTVSGSNVVVHHPAADPTCVGAVDAHAGNIEYWYCTECGKYWTDAEFIKEVGADDVIIPMIGHYIKNEAGALIIDPNIALNSFDDECHWTECRLCGNVLGNTKSAHRMTGELPTCCSGNHCLDCKYDDGIRNADNHIGDTEIQDAFAPVGNKPGYTGNTVCVSCGEIVSAGRYYYYECPDGCAEKLEYVEGIPKTCYADGVKPYYKCTMCGRMYLDEAAQNHVELSGLTDPCTGHDLHFSSSVTAGTSLKNIDHCFDGNFHWLGCQRCGKTLKELANELSGMGITSTLLELSVKGRHYGGTASCTELAKCLDCGEYYGELRPHEYNEINVCINCGYAAATCKAPTVSGTEDRENGTVSLIWNAVAGADHYEVWIKSIDDGSMKLAYSGSKTSTVLSGEGNGEPFYVKVRAISEDGAGGAFSSDQLFSCKIEHSFGAWEVITAATCDEDGEEKRVCSLCGKVETRVIPELGHKYNTTVTKPTCTDDGFTVYVCKVCGHTYKGDLVNSYGHSFGEWETINSATCTEKGLQKRTCGRCNISETRVTDPLGHNWRSWETVSPATCTDDGLRKHVCARCKTEETQTIAAFGHTCSETVTPPTCTADGFTTHICNTCGYTFTDTPVAATGHSYGEWVVMVPAVCATEGSGMRECSICGDIDSSIIPAPGHSYIDYVTPATCTEIGFTTHTCSVCGDEYIDSHVEPNGHSYSKGVCTVCGINAPNPGMPTVTATNIASSGKIKLTWTAVDDAVKYEVWRSASKNSGYTKLTTVKGTSCTNTSAKSGETYYYKVRAISIYEAYGDFGTAVKRACDLAQPVVKLSNVASTGKIKLTWTAVDGAVRYEIWRSTSENGKFTKLTSTSKTSCTNTSAKAGEKYYYKVKAIAADSNANSAYSAAKGLTCDLQQPSAKIVLWSGHPKLTWNAVDGAVKYEVYRATSKNGTYKKVITTTKPEYYNSSAKAGTTYYYKVKAVSSVTDANSAFSAIKSIKAR